tara:strand:- start:17205 stop:17855 length:651 start_codon:yes stop_codon:yes gene_type:complete
MTDSLTRIDTFLTHIQEGVKPNMFVVDVNFPEALSLTSQENKNIVNLLCKSTALPASNLGVIEVPFRGRTVKIAGDRTFDTWTATFFNDKDMLIRSFFEEWLEKMNTHKSNTAPLYKPSSGTSAADKGYMATVSVKQMRKDGTDSGTVLRQYDLLHSFPTNVSQIDLAYDSNDQIEEFSVEFQYSYWLSPSTPTVGGQGLASAVTDGPTFGSGIQE